MLHDINHKVRLAEVIVAREKDFGVNDQQYSCITHLGNILREGDVVFGYDFTNTNWNVDEEDNEDNVLDKHSSFPDLVLVRKVGYKYTLIILACYAITSFKIIIYIITCFIVTHPINHRLLFFPFIFYHVYLVELLSSSLYHHLPIIISLTSSSSFIINS